jgi:adenosine deaminase
MKVERLIQDTYKFIYEYQNDQACSTIKRIEKIFYRDPKSFNINEVEQHLKAFQKKLNEVEEAR